MKKLLLISFLAILVGCGGKANLSGTTPVNSSVTIPFYYEANSYCAVNTNACIVYVYRVTGQCPSVLSGSTGWTLLSNSAQPNYTDTTAVSGTTYTYVEEVVLANNAQVNSAPSVCYTETTP